MPASIRATWSASADAVEDYFARPDQAFVVEVDGRVVGFSPSRCATTGGVINNNAIAPEAQGRPGQRDVSRVRCACARRMVYATVHTGLRPSHAPARRAYEHVGFEPIRPHVVYYLKL